MYVFVTQRRRYGLSNLIGDTIMTFFTCGFWLIWVFIREIRIRSSIWKGYSC